MPRRLSLTAVLLLAGLGLAEQASAARYEFTGEVTDAGELSSFVPLGTPIVGEFTTASSSAPFGVARIGAEIGVFSLDHDGPMRLQLGSGLDRRDHLVLLPNPPPGSLITAMGPNVALTNELSLAPFDFLIDIVRPRGTLDYSQIPTELGPSLEGESSYLLLRSPTNAVDLKVAFRVTSFTQVPSPSACVLSTFLAAGLLPCRRRRPNSGDASLAGCLPPRKSRFEK
ncbi:hypothetical protein Pla123a_15110 [Posidoniimonas polymericola]|uniref:PEP-CTERM sorting domain-containing protein n=1 Tax=Posidoniimonas polymericola TaxID=2528002 RepID=A0A5C5YS21_9BACT|nr:hypothetical protein [Posidoniimonas polymericola]TWT77715.1 hypothetical protein Pla123a_15110 [Posidoniimonas polymericola]